MRSQKARFKHNFGGRIAKQELFHCVSCGCFVSGITLASNNWGSLCPTRLLEALFESDEWGLEDFWDFTKIDRPDLDE